MFAVLVGCGGDDDDGATATTAPDDGTTTSGGSTSTAGDTEGGQECPLTSEEVSTIIGSTVEEQPDLRTGSDCQYTGGGTRIVLGVRFAGATPEEYIEGNEEFFGTSEEVDGVGDQAAIFEDGTLLAFQDDQVISVLGATPDAAVELAKAVIAGL